MGAECRDVEREVGLCVEGCVEGTVEVGRKVCSGRERDGRYFHVRAAIGIPGEEAELRRRWGGGASVFCL